MSNAEPRCSVLNRRFTVKPSALMMLVTSAPFLILDGHCAGRGAPGDVTVRMSELRNSASKIVEYNITNNGSKQVFVTCAIEALYDEGWRELSNDVQGTLLSKMQRYSGVAPATTITLNFSPTHALRQSLIEQFDGGPFRLACRYTSESLGASVPKKMTWSDEFLIMP